MYSMARLKIFDTEELCDLLHLCAFNLAMAYQETQEHALFLTAERAYQARDFLTYAMQKQQSNHTIH